MKNVSIFLSVMVLFFFVPYARGQVEFGLGGGNEYGIGLLTRIGPPSLKLELGGGFSPQLVFWSINYGNDSYLKLYFPLSVGAKLSFAATKVDDKSRLGIKFGVGYNNIIKMGFGGGLDFSWGEKTRFVLSAGVMYYPKAYDELLDRLNDEEGTSYSKEDTSALLMNFQPFVSFHIFL